MKFECPNCKKAGSIDDANLRDAGVYAICPECNNRFLLQREPVRDARGFVFEPVENSHIFNGELADQLAEDVNREKKSGRFQPTEGNNAIWNPDAAAIWSIIFTPAFGSYLQMQNWQTLGKPDRAVSAKNWFYVSLAMLAMYLFLALSVADPLAADALAATIGFIYLIIWYGVAARSQGKHVKRKYGANYPRKTWLKPLLIGSAALISGLFLSHATKLLDDAPEKNVTVQKKPQVQYEKPPEVPTAIPGEFIFTALTALDTATGLIWARNGNIVGSMNWNGAMQWAESLEYAGYSDWRLPTKDELEAFSKLAEKRGFTNFRDDYYWSSSTYAGNSTLARCIKMNSGDMVYADKVIAVHYVWPVRRGR